MAQTISVALAVYNEEKNLAACLSSVTSFADEIVVVDGGSTDKTVDIAKKFKAKIIKTTNPPIFHINKQKALDACTKDWILQLDADEVIPEALKKEIISVINSQPVTRNTKPVNGYYIPRKNYFWGHWMRKGGQYPDFVIRLVRRGHAHFPSVTVHEQIAVDGQVHYLRQPMEHYSYRTKEDYWRKTNNYIALTALEMKAKHTPKNIFSYIYFCFWKPTYTFFMLFIRHKGFMDGWPGFLFAYWSGIYYALAYKKFVRINS